MELRCINGIKFAVLDNGLIEFKCRSNRCGAEPGVIILHQFDVLTGKLVNTLRLRDPGPHREERGGDNASEHNPVAVRAA